MGMSNYEGWTWRRDSIVDADGDIILMRGVALTTGCNREDQARAAENARLLFAAPDLLNACRLALAAFGGELSEVSEEGPLSEEQAERIVAILQITSSIGMATGELPP